MRIRHLNSIRYVFACVAIHFRPDPNGGQRLSDGICNASKNLQNRGFSFQVAEQEYFRRAKDSKKSRTALVIMMVKTIQIS